MQVEAIMRAASAVARAPGEAPHLEIMIPLVDYEQELEIMRELVVRIGDEQGLEVGEDYTVGTMIELPRACFVANRIAEHADFFSFGTNDLTQTALGFSRDDVESKFVPVYMERKIIDRSPFETIDKPGVGWLVRLAAWVGREAQPELKLGICGEHGGDPESIEFFHMAGLDYVSCSPFRVPIARVARPRKPPSSTRNSHDFAPSRPLAAVSGCRESGRVDRSRPTIACPRSRPSYPAVRRAEEECSLRTPFQRDRDRIVHCKAFRRLKHKTQVFVAPEGDHYRTRLTHTLEATQISRTVARALGLNEDLVGGDRARARPRPPAVRAHRRGRAGPLRARALRPRLPPQRALAAGGRRARAPQPHRRRCATGSCATRRGAGEPATLEGKIVRLVDRIAYINHDIDDALRAGVLRRRGPAGARRSRARRHRLAADRPARARPRRALRARRRHRPGRGGRRPRCCACAPSCSRTSTSGRPARAEHAKIERVLRGLFDWFCEHPEELPPTRSTAPSQADRVIDYLAGMTDRFAIRAWTERAVPQGLLV